MSASQHLLALETSGRTGSVALVAYTEQGAGSQRVTERSVPAGQRTAKVLVPAIHELLQATDVRADQLHGVAAATGPGSFTGLRVGVTIAKTLAYATGCKLVGVNTLDVIAHQAFAANNVDGRVWAVLDAQRQELFAARFDSPESVGQRDRTQLLWEHDWLGQLEPSDVVAGPVATKYVDQLPASVTITSSEACTPRAATVGLLGGQLLAGGHNCDPFALVPQYHRLSAAEEKAARAR